MRLRAATLARCSPSCAMVGCGGSGRRWNARRGRGCRRRAGEGPRPTRCRACPRRSIRSPPRGRAQQTVTRQVYEPLIERLSGPYRQGAPQAGLALEARPSRDRTTWTVTLRPGVRFQDGTPFNAAAVLANSRRWQSDPAGRRCFLTCSRSTRRGRTRCASCSTSRCPTWFARLELAPARDRLSPCARRRRAVRTPASSPDAGGSGTGPFQAGAERPRPADALPVRRLVGEPHGARALAGRGDLRPRSAAEPERFVCSGRAASRSPIRSGPPVCVRRRPIRCSTRWAGRSAGSAWRGRSGESTPPSDPRPLRRLADASHGVGRARRSPRRRA